MHVWSEVLAFREFMLIYTDLPAFQTLFSCHTHALASFSESVIPCSHTTTPKSGTQLRNSLRKSGRVCCKHCNIWTASCMLQFSRFRLAAPLPQPPSFSAVLLSQSCPLPLPFSLDSLPSLRAVIQSKPVQSKLSLVSSAHPSRALSLWSCPSEARLLKVVFLMNICLHKQYWK